MPTTATRTEPTPAKVGTKFVERREPHHEFTVQASCGAKGGAWFCITHQKSFRNQFEKDGHISRGRHTLCWICLEHGPEVP